MNSKVYISQKLCSNRMKVEIKPISELDKIKDSGVFVRVPYRNNGSDRNLTCHLANGNGLDLTLRIRPRRFSVHGTFQEGSYEVPQIGLQIYEWLRKSRGISVTGLDNCLLYTKHLDEVPPTPEGIQSAVSSFVVDVMETYPEIERRAREYLLSLDAEALKACAEYRAHKAGKR